MNMNTHSLLTHNRHRVADSDVTPGPCAACRRPCWAHMTGRCWHWHGMAWGTVLPQVGQGSTFGRPLLECEILLVDNAQYNTAAAESWR